MVRIRSVPPKVRTLSFHLTFARGVGHRLPLTQPVLLAKKLRTYLKTLIRATDENADKTRARGTVRAMMSVNRLSLEQIRAELAACCSSLDALIKPRDKPEEATARQWAEAFILRYLIVKPQYDGNILIESILHEALEVGHESFRFGFVFVPGSKHSIPQPHEEAIPALLKALVADLLKAWGPSASPADIGELLPELSSGSTDGLREEFVACNIALGKLLDPADEPDEKTLQRRAEAFLDDYLIVKPGNAKRFMDEAAKYALEQVELRRLAKSGVDLTSAKRKKRRQWPKPSTNA